MITDTCRTCKYWNINGECRRNPPLTVGETDTTCGRTAWPITEDIDWCGEYVDKNYTPPTYCDFDKEDFEEWKKRKATSISSREP